MNNAHPREHFIITAGKLGAALPLFVGVRRDRMKAIDDLCAVVGIARKGIYARQIVNQGNTTQLLPDVQTAAPSMPQYARATAPTGTARKTTTC